MPKWREARSWRGWRSLAIPRPGSPPANSSHLFADTPSRVFPYAVFLQIRDRVKAGLTIVHLVTHAVAEAIPQLSLYL